MSSRRASLLCCCNGGTTFTTCQQFVNNCFGSYANMPSTCSFSASGTVSYTGLCACGFPNGGNLLATEHRASFTASGTGIKRVAPDLTLLQGDAFELTGSFSFDIRTDVWDCILQYDDNGEPYYTNRLAYTFTQAGGAEIRGLAGCRICRRNTTLTDDSVNFPYPSCCGFAPGVSCPNRIGWGFSVGTSAWPTGTPPVVPANVRYYLEDGGYVDEPIPDAPGALSLTVQFNPGCISSGPCIGCPWVTLRDCPDVLWNWSRLFGSASFGASGPQCFITSGTEFRQRDCLCGEYYGDVQDTVHTGGSATFVVG